MYVTELLQPFLAQLTEEEREYAFFSRMALRRILYGFKCHMSIKNSETNVRFHRFMASQIARSICDFYLWGNLKDKVYSNNPHTIEELKINIHNAIVEITPNELANVGNMLKHAELSIQVHDEQFQHLL